MDKEKKIVAPTAPYSNFTSMSNEIWDNIDCFTPVEFMIYCFIHRKIFGWQDKRMDLTDKISTSQIVKGTGLSKNSVLRVIKSLQDKGLIIKTTTKGSKNSKGINQISLVFNQKVVPQRDKGSATEGQDSPKGSASKRHTKETCLNKLSKESNIILNNNKSNNKDKDNNLVTIHSGKVLEDIIANFKANFGKLNENEKFTMARYGFKNGVESMRMKTLTELIEVKTKLGWYDLKQHEKKGLEKWLKVKLEEF